MKNNKVKVIIYSLICVVLIISFVVFRKQTSANASITYIQEPTRTSDIPSNMVWNTYTGGYYDKNIYKWNFEIMKYEKIVNDDKSYIPPESKKIDELQIEWYEKNKNTTDVLDKAIATYYYNRKNGINIYRPGDIEAMCRSFYTPQDDYNLELITSLGIAYLPEMIKKIKNNDPFCTVLIPAVYMITNAQSIPSVLSVDNNSYIKWQSAFKKLSDDVKTKSKEYDSKLKDADVNIEEFKCFSKDAGLFILPHIKDIINKGEVQYIKYLPEIVENYDKAIKADLETKDILFWEKWFKEHDLDIEVLRKVIE